jgi:hypothetical protein
LKIKYPITHIYAPIAIIKPVSYEIITKKSTKRYKRATKEMQKIISNG